MKSRFLLLAALLCLSGCSLLSSPTTTARKFIASAEKGDVDAMTDLFSSKAKEKLGLEEIRSNNEQFAGALGKTIANGAKFKISELEETRDGNDASVTFLYEDKEATNSMRMEFELSKENGTWKIDNLGSGESKNTGGIGGTSLGSPRPAQDVEPPPPPVSLQSPSAPASPQAARSPISGGVLNGKATSLPKPPYPPIARAAKASGTVVVQVLVDENGNVISAHAVSGHPLLQAACVGAARGAKFSPTKLSGQPVKVSGVITYNFESQQ